MNAILASQSVLMMRRFTTWSMQDLSARTPVCSSLSFVSTEFLILRSKINLVNTLLKREFWQSLRFPFLGSFAMWYIFHYISTSSFPLHMQQQVNHDGCSDPISDFMTSGGVLFDPGASPFLILLSAFTTSALEMESRLTSKSSPSSVWQQPVCS